MILGRYDGEIIYKDEEGKNASSSYIECSYGFILEEIEKYKDKIVRFKFERTVED